MINTVLQHIYYCIANLANYQAEAADEASYSCKLYDKKGADNKAAVSDFSHSDNYPRQIGCGKANYSSFVS